MPSCKNCGEVISETQFHNYTGLCPDCVRLKMENKTDPILRWFIIFIVIMAFLMFVFIIFFD